MPEETGCSLGEWRDVGLSADNPSYVILFYSYIMRFLGIRMFLAPPPTSSTSPSISPPKINAFITFKF
jgi:hypothetical protein